MPFGKRSACSIVYCTLIRGRQNKTVEQDTINLSNIGELVEILEEEPTDYYYESFINQQKK